MNFVFLNDKDPALAEKFADAVSRGDAISISLTPPTAEEKARLDALIDSAVQAPRRESPSRMMFVMTGNSPDARPA